MKNIEIKQTQKTKKEIHVDCLVNHLIRWSKEHQAPVAQSVEGLSLGTLTQKTTRSLNAVTAAYTPDILLAAANLLIEFEGKHGAVADVLERAEVIRTRRGYVMNPVFLNDDFWLKQA